MAFLAHIVGGMVELISLANILLGVTFAQFYVYSHSWNRDPKWMKYLAIAILILELAYTVLAQRTQYFYSVLAIENPALIATIYGEIPPALFLVIIAEFIVQGYYLHRIWIFSRIILLPVTLVFLLIVRHGLLIYCVVEAMLVDSWLALEARPGFKAFFVTAMAVIIATDAIVAVIMVYFLRKRQTHLKKTRGIISWLILYFVSTGGILVAISLAGLISFLANEDTLLWGGFVLLYARALVNSFFGILNARQQLRTQKGEIVTFGGISIPSNAAQNSVELHKIVHAQTNQDSLAIASTNGNNEGSDLKFTSVTDATRTV